jgi:hypothetical protein
MEHRNVALICNKKTLLTACFFRLNLGEKYNIHLFNCKWILGLFRTQYPCLDSLATHHCFKNIYLTEY